MTKMVVIPVAALLAFLLFFMLLLVPQDDAAACEASDSGNNENIEFGTGKTIKPEEMPPSVFTSGFGERWGSTHWGADISGGFGTPIYAFADGVVTRAGAATGFGNWITIKHTIDGQPFETVYGHMKTIYVSPGDQVAAGQHIADEASEGESTGSHLHFEIHPNQWEPKNAIDPQPYVESAINRSELNTTSNQNNANQGESQNEIQPSNVASEPINTGNPDVDAALQGLNDTANALNQAVDFLNQLNEFFGKTEEQQSDSGAPSLLEKTPASVGSEAHLQYNSVRGMRLIAAAFPQITTIGGWRENDSFPDHPSGAAIDIMIPNYDSAEGIELGNAIRAIFLADGNPLDVKYTIWRQQYTDTSGSTNMMEDRGSPTQNHMDHVHVTFNDSPIYNGEDIPVPNIDGINLNLSLDCGNILTGGVDNGGLMEGTVPEDMHEWFLRAGSLCTDITPALLAAQVQQESGFQRSLTSGAGAKGISQFIDATWQEWGWQVDDQGNQIPGTQGLGDRNDPGDAIMAQGRFMCHLAALANNSSYNGSIQELALAGYNAGWGAVQAAGGVPPFRETRNYVAAIIGNMDKYAL